MKKILIGAFLLTIISVFSIQYYNRAKMNYNFKKQASYLKERISKINASTIDGLDRKPASPMQFSLHPRIVEEMENQTQVLKSQATIKKEKNGWRVHLLKQNTLFHKAGIQDNELILFDEPTLDLKKEKNDLTKRLKMLLNRLAE